MITVLTKEQDYKLDKDTIESGHLSQEKLMDNAGKSVAQFFCEKIDNPFNQKVVVICGKGNNGGDGVIAHSYLKKYNVSSKIVFTEKKHGHSELLKKYKVSKSEYSIYNEKIKFDKYDWIIDGIFGIGLSRELNLKYKKIVKLLNNNQIVSIDIPSGLSCNSNEYKYCINPKYTISFGYPKIGHYLNCVENLNVSDIDFKLISSDIQAIEYSDVSNILKPFKKKDNSHKYSKGRLTVSAGSNHYPGAAILCSMAAYKTGSGYVNLYFAGDEKIRDNIKSQYPDIILNQDYPSSNFCLFGPGYDFEEDPEWPCLDDGYTNIVCDASILTEAAGASISDFPQNSILTPHAGEFQSLFRDIEKINALDLLSIKDVQKIIENRIVILKSFNTFIITKDMIYIMDRGPSLLATAGTGDVLSGILVSLLSQGYSRLEASILGTYLHAEAANYYMNNISKDGMTASDLIDCIPYAFNELRKNV